MAEYPHSTEYLRALLEAGPDVIMVAGPDGGITYVNRTVDGVSQEQTIGSSLFDWVPEQYHETMDRAQRRAFDDRQPTSYEIQGHGEQGRETWWSTRVGPIIEDGAVTAIVLIARDITARKRAEQVAEHAHQQLEQRVAKRTAHLDEEISRRKRLESELKRVADLKRKFAGEVVKGQELERKRVARELHDTIVQGLFALRMDAEWIHDHCSDALDVAATADKLSARLAETITTVRNVIHDLRPSVLDDVGICGAIESYAKEITDELPMELTIEVVEDKGLATPDVTIAVYRIAQEALTNAIRHSRCSKLKIVISDSGRELCLIVTDNGTGFADVGRAPPMSLGLLGMRERASLLGGELEIESQPGKGSSINLRIPYTT